jgi:hypothetical protein
VRGFTATGAPDPTFGTSGSADIGFTRPPGDDIHAAVDTTGRIYVSINDTSAFSQGASVIRLAPNGAADETYGPAGVRRIYFGRDHTPTARKVVTLTGDAHVIAIDMGNALLLLKQQK